MKSLYQLPVDDDRRIVAGCRMPSDATIGAADRELLTSAQHGSQALLDAILRLPADQRPVIR